MQPTRVTKIADKLFEAIEPWAGRFDEIDKRFSTRLGDWGAVLWFAIAAVPFLLVGRREMAPWLFGGFAVLILGARAYENWERKHPLKPVEQRTLRDEVRPALEAMIGGVLMFAFTLIVSVSIDPPVVDPFDLIVNTALGVAGTYRIRSGDTRGQERSGLLIGPVLFVVMWLVFWAAAPAAW
jgi:hypothetical protein